MSEVNSLTIKAYARSLNSMSVAVEEAFSSLGMTTDGKLCASHLRELSSDLMAAAKEIALKEFDEEWGKV